MKKGLVGIITGASTGIGRALAVQLAKEFQAKLLLNARGAEELETTARLVREVGGEAETVVGDVANRELLQTIAKSCIDKFGRVDLLVNNAGLAKSGPMHKLSPDDWRYVFDVNFFAPVELAYAVMPKFKEQGCGKIVNVASVAGKVAFPGSVCYSASKFALTGFSEGMAAEFAGQGVDVITVCPGWVRTEFFKKNKAAEDPSAIANERNVRGWAMKHLLSISSEQAANDIIRALEKEGSHELVLTAPAVVIERMAGVMPGVTHFLSSLVPAERGRCFNPKDRLDVSSKKAATEAKAASSVSAAAENLEAGVDGGPNGSDLEQKAKSDSNAIRQPDRSEKSVVTSGSRKSKR